MKKLLSFLDKYLLKIAISFIFGFIALYPKLPSIYIHHTWVYIRLEDYLIASLIVIWIFELVRRKVKFGFVGIPIGFYWIAGFLSFLYSLIVLGPHLSNFFPSVAALSYLRRIEYMLLFFVAFSSVRTKEDLKDYLKIVIITVAGIVLYGLGQKFYVVIYQAFPAIFHKVTFCFPSFQTGNEEFAKGIPLCLPFDGRITSTFAGHYDLAAYMVIVIPILIALIFAVRRRLYKILITLLVGSSAVILVLTASRISFIAYVLGGMIILGLIKRKKFIVPFLIFSAVILLAFSQSTARRFLQTFRLASVVTNAQGQVVGEDISNLTAEQRAKLAQGLILGNVVNQNLPLGSGFIGLPKTGKGLATNSAVVRSSISIEEARRLQLENGGVKLSTIQGNFKIEKAFVYDISFTTRFQAEWPNAIRAFLMNPLIGSGYSTITLATDNDFLRFLGESGILGLLTFLSIFIFFAIITRNLLRSIDDTVTKFFILGLWSGVIGLFINASLIDVFESSKVAESLWILFGWGLGALYLYQKHEIKYLTEIKNVLTSSIAFVIYFFVTTLGFFGTTLGNFFVADDFTWLKWAGQSTIQDIGNNFINANGFFYRPIDKAIIFFLYTVLGFDPTGYHLFTLFVHSISAVGVYLFSRRIFNDKYKAFLTSLIFLLLPSQGENIFWFATISTTVAAMFIIYSLYSYIRFRASNNLFFYITSLILSGLALFTYEVSVVVLPLVILIDFLLLKIKPGKKLLLSYLPFVFLDVIYLAIRTHSNVAPVGGSYSYSLIHAVPNVIGNFLGYLALFIFGESSIPVYNSFRASLREDSLIILPLILIFIIVLGFVLFATKKRIQNLSGKENVRVFIFGLAFAFFAMITFLPLGNIAERYSYLPSVGFSISFVIFIYLIANKISRINKKINFNFVVIVLSLMLIGVYLIQLTNEKNEWNYASRVTQRTLSYFKLYHETVPDHANLYIVNYPIKRAQAWIFPLGLNDPLWFIYGDQKINIVNFPTVDKAKNSKNSLKSEDKSKTYIFNFDKNDKMEEIK